MTKTRIAETLIANLRDIAEKAAALTDDKLLQNLLRRAVLRVANAGEVSAEGLAALLDERILH